MDTEDESTTSCRTKRSEIYAITDHHSHLVRCHPSEEFLSVRKKRKSTIIDDHGDEEEHIDKQPVFRWEQFFMSTVTDDLLFEIFLRFPNLPFLIQCSIVCKRWFFLITSTQFILNFNQFRHNRKRYSSTTSVPFEIFFIYHECPNFHKLISEKVNNNKPKIIPSDLNFLPWPNGVIRACFEDLLLVSHKGSFKDYCICNPFTKQWLTLPESTHENTWGLLKPSGYGLMCEPHKEVRSTITSTSNNINDQYRYRVVLIFKCQFSKPGAYDFSAFIFCSETGKWLESYTSLLHSLDNKIERRYANAIHDIVASNGLLYWLGGFSYFKGIVACDPLSCDPFAWDPFNNERLKNGTIGHFIHLPAGFGHKCRRLSSKGKVCLGVVRGQLRLLQLVKVNRTCFRLKVWELIDYGDATRSWLPVHEVKLKGVDRIFVLAFHPNNSNAIFVLRDHNIYLYEIEKEKYENISEFPYYEYYDNVNETAARFSSVFTIMQPLWPTAVPFQNLN
ncbi:F-box domain containing protein [Trema orientale]|uniref:F-box domain containing protein n=1 Tax=Trema orientale TaxID=63057 RepID=A0A2P5ER18_TREOI|nr:F-box domain containing protein [Trema orientale]